MKSNVFKKNFWLFVFTVWSGGLCTQVHSDTDINDAREGDNVKSVVQIAASAILDFNGNRQVDPVINALKKSEFKLLLASLPKLQKFPENSYSGCHARAHYDYLQLSKLIPNKAYKVWLLSGSLLSPAIQGAVSYVDKNGNKASWDYHVAVAFLDENGHDWVVDRLISPTPIKLSKWASEFDIDGYAVLTRINPEMYLFNNTVVPALDPVNHPNGFLKYFVPKNVFNGSFYAYEGEASNGHWGASDLAADALSSGLLKGSFPSCEWKNLASQSLQLKEKASSSPVSEGCENAALLYQDEFKLWVSSGL